MRVAVVGAGPAGSTAAISLLRHGADSVTIYETMTGPRGYCAGGLGLWALRRLSDLDFIREAVSKATRSTIRSFRVELAEDGRVLDSFTVTADDLGVERLGVVVDRPTLDRLLFIRAKREGALAIAKYANPERLAKIYDVVVDARGFTGAPESCEREYVVQYEIPSRTSDEIVVRLDKSIGTGYMWAFPKGPVMEYGFGEDMKLWPRNRQRILRAFEEFTGYSIDELRSLSRRTIGASLPLYSGRAKLKDGDRIFKVGTSACLVDPLTGAGIKYAVISGWRLGKIVAQMPRRLASLSYSASMKPVITELRLLLHARKKLFKKIYDTNSLAFASELLRRVKKRSPGRADLAYLAAKLVLKLV